MALLERITVDPNVMHGRPAVRGTRVRVADVLSLLAAGATELEILEDYPYLEPEDIKPGSTARLGWRGWIGLSDPPRLAIGMVNGACGGGE